MQRLTSSLPLFTGLLLALLVAEPASAQRSVREIRQDIAFARGLAGWQFIEMAEEIIGEIEAEVSAEELQEEVGLAKCDIYADAARLEGDILERHALFEKAVSAYEDFIDSNPFSDGKGDAELALIDTSKYFGNDLETRLEEAVGEERSQLRDLMENVLTSAISLANEKVESIQSESELTQAQERARTRLMINQSQMLLSLGRSSEDGTYFLTQAVRALERLIDMVEPQTGPAFLGYVELMKVYLALGEYTDAADYGMYVVDAVLPTDTELWEEAKVDMPPSEQDQRWYLVELATSGLCDALGRLGSLEEGCFWALHFYNAYQREGFTLSRPDGYRSMLAAARVLMDSGGYVGGRDGSLEWFQTQDEMEGAGFKGRRDTRSALTLALSLAEQVNRDNRGNIYQVRAQKLISEAINRPGLDVSPDTLFEAAEGEYNNRNYVAATEAYKRCLRALANEGDATRIEFGPKVLYRLGLSYERQDRVLEACMAYREGIQEEWIGDPENDTKNVQGYNRMAIRLRKAAPGDDAIDALWRDSEDRLVEINREDAGDTMYNQALRTYSEEEYEAARDRFLEVPGNANNYEKAVVYAGVTLYRLGRESEASAELQRYLEVYVPDPKNVTTSETKAVKRKEAMAMATYYVGYIAYRAAKRGTGTYDEVVRWLDGFENEYGDQPDLAVTAMYLVCDSHLELGQFDEAEAKFESMRARFAESTRTGNAGLKILKALKERRENLLAASDESGSREALEKMAFYANTYNSLSNQPNWQTLRDEADYWAELGEWEKARAALEETLSAFSDSRAEDVQKYVQPDLAHCYLELQRVAEAFEILDPMVPDPTDKNAQRPTSAITYDYCRAVAGWVIGGPDEFIEVPGVGSTADDFTKAILWYGRLEAGREKWTCEWYAIKFEVAYAKYRWGQIDSERLELAQSDVAFLRTELDPQLEGIEESCGDELLRRRFLALWKLVQ